jgi:putative oxidoreductase
MALRGLSLSTREPINRLTVVAGKRGGAVRFGYGERPVNEGGVMSDQIVTLRGRADQAEGQAAVSSLAERLTALAPAPSLQPGPAAESPAAAPRRARSVTGAVVASYVAACAFIPYALVALALRLVMARLLFLDGQTRIEGPQVPFTLHDVGFSVVLPLQVRPETVTGFMTQSLPLPPMLTAYLVSYGEFVLPILLVLGLATRFSALTLLIATALIQVYVAPQALWTAHIYWAAIALVLLSQGPGQISLDHLIRLFARR